MSSNQDAPATKADFEAEKQLLNQTLKTVLRQHKKNLKAERKALKKKNPKYYAYSPKLAESRKRLRAKEYVLKIISGGWTRTYELKICFSRCLAEDCHILIDYLKFLTNKNEKILYLCISLTPEYEQSPNARFDVLVDAIANNKNLLNVEIIYGEGHAWRSDVDIRESLFPFVDAASRNGEILGFKIFAKGYGWGHPPNLFPDGVPVRPFCQRLVYIFIQEDFNGQQVAQLIEHPKSNLERLTIESFGDISESTLQPIMTGITSVNSKVTHLSLSFRGVGTVHGREQDGTKYSAILADGLANSTSLTHFELDDRNHPYPLDLATLMRGISNNFHLQTIDFGNLADRVDDYPDGAAFHLFLDGVSFRNRFIASLWEPITMPVAVILEKLAGSTYARNRDVIFVALRKNPGKLLELPAIRDAWNGL